MRISDQALKGRNVIAADGVSIGSEAMALIEVDDWRVESLRISLHNDIADRLGVARSWRHKGAIEVPTRMVQSVGDAVVLSVGVDELKQVLRKKAEPKSEPPPAPPQ